MTVLVGTSGWHYAHWRDRFYPHGCPSGRWLEWYATRYPTVEINATFYRLTAEATLRSWRDTVPDGFVFAVKASRYLTHVRRLKDPREPVELFLERTAALGDRRGPILLQLPPDLHAEPDRLEETLRCFGPSVRVAVEVRHPSWDRQDVRELLSAHGAALCLADRRGHLAPEWRTADWGYVRFHAGRASPWPHYGRQALTTWAGEVARWWPEGDVYAYFNNDQEAVAPGDARDFARRCRRAGLEVAAVA
ncbi:DUF72 domain-containing protein [Acidimicrobiaceae bacterium USS-CC1]|uniref:DUF72 domain-containing protein n=1 Tax=Acidiferrimicrobium australe TaxID=2664430 RepID=A0ABW9QRH7_9ACTN|nr:DUF72 domain-containing protein [Acidiferrimicrobium australe]